MEITEIIVARGHKNIQAMHQKTIEITKEEHLSRKGNCIIAVSADKALADLSPTFKKSLRIENARLTVMIEAGGIAETVNAYGSPQLPQTDSTEMVIRKSEYISGRTLAIRADKAAADLSRRLVKRLRNPEQTVKITLTVRTL